VTWSSVICPNGGFWSWLWWNQTSKYSYDLISVTSSPLRHRKTSPNNVTKIFALWALLNQNFWLRQWSWSCKLVVLLHHWCWHSDVCHIHITWTREFVYHIRHQSSGSLTFQIKVRTGFCVVKYIKIRTLNFLVNRVDNWDTNLRDGCKIALHISFPHYHTALNSQLV